MEQSYYENYHYYEIILIVVLNIVCVDKIEFPQILAILSVEMRGFHNCEDIILTLFRLYNFLNHIKI
jgi:hypothetical protein